MTTEMKDIALPSWAKLAGHQEAGQIPRVDVNAAAMLELWLGEFAANPPRPGEIPGMTPEEGLCDPAKPTQYWLECAHQCMKMDLQIAARRFAFEIRLHGDPTKKYALAKWPPGRGIDAATKGYEAKAHYKRIRGMLPAG